MKYIDADILRKEVKRLEKTAHKSALGCADSETRKFHEGKDFAYQYVGTLIDSLQQEQPEEICHKCIHHGKDDDYCYNPHGGIQSRINENGVYDCTGFCEKEQEQPEVDLEKEVEKYLLDNADFVTKSTSSEMVNTLARHFYELGRKTKED